MYKGEQMKQIADKYNIRDILVEGKGFTPSLLEVLTNHIDLLMKVECMKCQQSE